MKEQIIITIGRTFGSGGREIGEKLAKRLGISFYDKNLIDLAAKKSGMDKKLLDNADEQLVSRFVDPYVPEDGNVNYKLYMTQFKIINELAAKESCVIVGRLADYILRADENCLKIFIYAPDKVRMERVMKRYALSETEAKKKMKQMDKTRKSYCNYFTDRQWDGTEGRDFMIDSSWLGIDGTIELLYEMIMKWKAL